MEQEENKKESRNISLPNILAWIFGILFLLGGVGTLVGETISGVLLIVASIFVLPPLYEILRKKTNLNLSKGVRILVVLILLVFAISISSTSDVKNVSDNVEQTQAVQDTDEASQEQISDEEQSTLETAITEEQPRAQEDVTVGETKHELTLGKRQAVSSAKSYLDYAAFSRSGLIKQLEFEGFTRQQAEYGVSQTNADWNEQAALSAKSYLEFTSFSRSGLIKQLEFEGFTRQQAEYGVSAVGY